MKDVRNLVRNMLKENLKVMGIDLSTWTLRVGTATYYEGDFMDISQAPFWPRLKTHAHILHNAGDTQTGVGYLKGETIITKETALHSMFRVSEVPDTLTKVLAHGSGEINTNNAEETQETCGKLKSDWDNIITSTAEHADKQTFIVLTSDLYCPTELRELIGKYFRELTLETAYANDGTPIDIIADSIVKHDDKPGKPKQKPKPKNWFQEDLSGAQNTAASREDFESSPRYNNRGTRTQRMSENAAANRTMSSTTPLTNGTLRASSVYGQKADLKSSRRPSEENMDSPSPTIGAQSSNLCVYRNSG